MADETESPLLKLGDECVEALFAESHRQFFARLYASPEETDEPNLIIWRWAMTLATLSYDIGRSALALVRLRQPRGASILCRTLFDYWVRLEYYRQRPGEAVDDYRDRHSRTRRLVNSVPTEVLRDLKLDEKVAGLDAFLAEPGIVRDRRFADMVKVARPESWRSLYAMLYLTRGSLVHGNEHAIGDVLQSVTLPGETQSRTSLNHGAGLESLDSVLGEIVQHLVQMLGVFGQIFGTDEPHRRLEGELRAIGATSSRPSNP